MNHSIPVLKILSGMLAIAAISVAYGQTTSRVSVANGTGVQGNGASQQASISADGRYVVFTSLSTNLAGTTSLNQVFKRDTLLGITTLVSSDSGGSPANADCTNPRVSSDGQYVVFSTAATNMVGGDTNGVKDVFVRDTNPGGGVSRVSG